jgi:hypothetical protein
LPWSFIANDFSEKKKSFINCIIVEWVFIRLTWSSWTFSIAVLNPLNSIHHSELRYCNCSIKWVLLFYLHVQ